MSKLNDPSIRRLTISFDIPYDYYSLYTEDRWRLILEAIRERANDYAQKRMGTEAAILLELSRIFSISLAQFDKMMLEPLAPIIMKKEDLK